MKFSTGLLIGGITGTVYALLTAKRTGAEQQQAIAQYFTDVSGATQDVQQAVTGLGDAINNLKHEIDTTLAPAVKDITDSVEVFDFETSARMQNIQEHVDVIDSAVNKLSE